MKSRARNHKLLLPIFGLFLVPTLAQAAVEITHVEYDLPGTDEGREWIEIMNKGSEPVDLTGFKFLEGGVKHKLSVAVGSATLLPAASAVIASDPTTFLNEHAGFAKSVFKSSFSLSNTGETLALINAQGEIEHSLAYTAPPKQAPSKAPARKTTRSDSPTVTRAASSTQAAAVAEANEAKQDSMAPWLLGLAAIVGLGVLSVWFAPSARVSGETRLPEDEFEILY